MSTIPSAPNFPTPSQNPANSILDVFNRQVYLGNQYILSTGSTTIASTSETPLYYLINNSTTKSLFVNLKKLACLSATANAVFRFYFNPTITANGTAKTPINLRPALTNPSVANAYLSPTASGFGTYVAELSAVNFSSEVSTLLSIFDPGQSFLMTVQTSVASINVAAEVSWYEI